MRASAERRARARRRWPPGPTAGRSPSVRGGRSARSARAAGRDPAPAAARSSGRPWSIRPDERRAPVTGVRDRGRRGGNGGESWTAYSDQSPPRGVGGAVTGRIAGIGGGLGRRWCRRRFHRPHRGWAGVGEAGFRGDGNAREAEQVIPLVSAELPHQPCQQAHTDSFRVRGSAASPRTRSRRAGENR
ncbi:hypothetical protein FRACA_1890008 [Frankia canadensis]|uniref:Uncharacterized protein n=1 Tax=Frankia canadensis TaxID=1836972 RepID=A0A2I2KP17_9ACTN|nr:hypothetical protein FRACA_1890008 [Frankia canadensis]SOU54705.1 hypothetical protein FRACA_1890008 [Frankia canadensis]